MMSFLIETDGSILLWMQVHMRTPFLTAAFTFVTHLGDAGLIWLVCALALLAVKKTRRVGCVLPATLVVEAALTNVLLKNLVARARPYETVEGLTRLIAAPPGYSFPSGHSGCSFAAATVLFVLCPKRIGIPAFVLAFLIAFSRLYVGVHFPSDVIAGALVGVFCGLGVCAIFKCGENRKNRRKGTDVHADASVN